MTPAVAATFALLAGVALKRAEDKAEQLVDESHIPLHQEDR